MAEKDINKFHKTLNVAKQILMKSTKVLNPRRRYWVQSVLGMTNFGTPTALPSPAIDVDLVNFSRLIVSWNAMENVIRAVHVCNCASYISAYVCPTSSASDEVQQIIQK